MIIRCIAAFSTALIFALPAVSAECTQIGEWNAYADAITENVYKNPETGLIEYTGTDDEPKFLFSASARLNEGMYDFSADVNFYSSPEAFTFSIDGAELPESGGNFSLTAESGIATSISAKMRVRDTDQTVSLYIRSAPDFAANMAVMVTNVQFCKVEY